MLVFDLTTIFLLNPQIQVVTVSNITPALFNDLQTRYGESLLCPCATRIVLYNSFITNTVDFHPICSSIFVSQQWIEALNIPNAAVLGMTDFRTTASSQVSEL